MSSKKILMVTRNPQLRELASVAFEVVARWKMLIADSADDSLAKASSHLPDAILVDCESGNADAIGLANQLGQNPATSSIPVVLLTRNVTGGKPTGNFKLALLDSAMEGVHPRKLASDVAQLLGWQPRWMTKPSTQARLVHRVS